MVSTTPEEFIRFAEDLLRTQGMVPPEVSEDELADLAQDLGSDINTFTHQYLVSQMTPEASLLYAQIAQERGAEEAARYLEQQLPDLPTLIASALADFQLHYLRTA